MSQRKGLDLHTVLMAAADIANDIGWDQVTLASLAKKLSIKTPSLYNHIESLSDLRQKLAVHAMEIMYQRMTLAAIGQSGDSAVRAIAKAYLDFARHHPGLYESTLRAPHTDEPDLQRAANQIVELNVKVFESFALNEEQTIHAVRAFRSLVHGFASIEQRAGFGLPYDIDVSFEWLIDIYLSGLHSLST